MSGYIKLYRGWRDTDGLTRSKVFSDCEAWLWLLENCTWKTVTRFNGKGEEIALSPGQIHVSIRSLSSAWGWSNKAVRTFLTRLERVQKVTQLKAQSGTVLTVCNWAKYQGLEDDEGHSQGHSRGTVGAQSGHTQEEGKEGKEGKKDTRVRLPAARPDTVPQQVWADFLALRRAKRAPLTETALSVIEREAEKAGWPLAAAITESVSRGWQSFKAEWVANSNASRGYPAEHSGVPL